MLLEVEAVTAGYGQLLALRDVSLTVQSGEVVAIVGGNGAGKSTLLSLVSGLVRPRSGAVRFEQQPIQSVPAHRIVDLGIACVPEGRALFAEMTVWENLAMGSHLPDRRASRKETLEEVVALFPVLRARLRQIAGTLSGGEQQMLAIGRALMSRPRLLLLDEPSLGVAPLMVERIYESVAAIVRRGMSLLLVEQNVPLALRIATRGYVLQHGAIVLSGRSQDLANNLDVRKAYLGL